VNGEPTQSKAVGCRSNKDQVPVVEHLSYIKMHTSLVAAQRNLSTQNQKVRNGKTPLDNGYRLSYFQWKSGHPHPPVTKKCKLYFQCFPKLTIFAP
jgi:hypothetical protein